MSTASAAAASAATPTSWLSRLYAARTPLALTAGAAFTLFKLYQQVKENRAWAVMSNERGAFCV